VTRGSVSITPESTTAAAPVTPARPAVGARLRVPAAAALAACLVSLAGFGRYEWRHRPVAAALDTAPFKIGDAAWRSVLTVATTTESSCPPSVPVVIVYVSKSCLHCRAELERWANLVRTGAPQLSCIGLAIVAAPARSAALADWLPRELAPALLWDHDGTVARTLDVRLVPLAAFVTSTGVVTARTVGEASEASTSGRLAELRRISGARRGVH
jgi:hypothetical protein